MDDERADLIAELRVAREALIATADGLTDEQVGARPTVSVLSLGGLIKHVAHVEERWLRFVVDGPDAMRYDLPDGVSWDELLAGTARAYPQWIVDHQNTFRMLPGDSLAGIVRHYRQVGARSEEIIGSVPDLATTHPLPEAPWHEAGAKHSVRRVLMHVIAETAQHTGHADILRETIDGKTAT